MPAESDESTPWWRNPYLLVPAIAAILAATIGGIIQAAGGSGGASSPARTPTVSSPAASAAPAPTTGTTTHATTPAYYQRPIPVIISSGGNGLDFDLSPPGPDPGPVSFFYNTFALQKGGSSTVSFGFAVWTKGGMPSASDCKTWVSTHLVDHVYAPTAGTKICFRTDQGRVGLLIVQQGTSENQFNANARVWGF